MSVRDTVLDSVTEAVLAARRNPATLVGIDGRSAAGKSHFGDEVAERLRSIDVPCDRASIDDFHPPVYSQRSSSGAFTVETYYDEGFDFELFRALLLEPARTGEPCLLRRWDAARDVSYLDEPTRLVHGTVLVVDGAFIQRPELRGYWDLVIWLDIGFETMLERALVRELAWMPSAEAIERKYRERWIPVHALYEAKTGARDKADLVIDNADFRAPRLVRSGTV